MAGKKHSGHATRGGFRGSRGMGAGTGGGMPGLSDMPMAGGAPSGAGSEDLAPGETQAMPAPMPGAGASDPGAGSFEPNDNAMGAAGSSGGMGFKRGGRIR